jgi:signal transduction histidine kinase
MFRDELEKSFISVHTDIKEGLPELRGDRLQLQQVVFNLPRSGIDAIKDMRGRLPIYECVQPPNRESNYALRTRRSTS